MCKECGKEFAKCSGLGSHYNSIHGVGKDTKFVCDIEGCEKSYTMKQTLASHKRQVHSTQAKGSNAKYVCEQCGKAFKASGSLTVIFFL